MDSNENAFQRLGQWMRQSVTLKLATIGLLILVLLIPTEMIKSIIYEREALNAGAQQEISQKWANEQQITGPILTLPVEYLAPATADKEAYTYIKYLNILPETLDISGLVEPEIRSRGIYETVLYRSDLSLKGQFNLQVKPDPDGMSRVFWDRAFVTVGISDLRGLTDRPVLSSGDQKWPVEPGSNIEETVPSGITVRMPDLSEKAKLEFDLPLQIQGSRLLTFVPLGSETTTDITSTWTDPSFTGAFLPRTSDITDKGFRAKWKVTDLNRNYPQQWMNTLSGSVLEGSGFGVRLFQPVDDYQKAMRSAKYAILTLALTFLIFFLIEVLTQQRIHPFQYTLVGLALCLFYILLLSLSEHLLFNQAYGLSAGLVVIMIGSYTYAVVRNWKLALLLCAILTAIYGFLYVTLQLTDYALLFGSLGLAIILGATMFATRNINWYRLNSAPA